MIPLAFYHSLLPSWPKDQRCFGTDKHPHICGAEKINTTATTSTTKQTHLNNTGCGSSSTPGFSKSSNVASPLSFHNSSNLLICVDEIWRARSCSWSEGILTSQVKKHRSSINGIHCVVSQFMSLEEGTAAHGCLGDNEYMYIHRHTQLTCKSRQPQYHF